VEPALDDGATARTIRNLLLLRDMPLQIMLAACIHFLATTPVVTGDGKVRAKWELVRIVEDEPPATTWKEFCRVHLGMHDTVASRYKRMWDTIAVEANLTVGERRELPARLRKARAMAKGGHVYLLSSKELGFKIGRTIDVGRRLQELIQTLDTQIEVVCSGWFDDCAMAEMSLHEYFRDKRKSGEWFALSESDVEYIWGYFTFR